MNSQRRRSRIKCAYLEIICEFWVVKIVRTRIAITVALHVRKVGEGVGSAGKCLQHRISSKLSETCTCVSSLAELCPIPRQKMKQPVMTVISSAAFEKTTAYTLLRCSSVAFSWKHESVQYDWLKMNK